MSLEVKLGLSIQIFYMRWDSGNEAKLLGKYGDPNWNEMKGL